MDSQCEGKSEIRHNNLLCVICTKLIGYRQVVSFYMCLLPVKILKGFRLNLAPEIYNTHCWDNLISSSYWYNFITNLHKGSKQHFELLKNGLSH